MATNVLAITSFIFLLHHFLYLCITEGASRVNVATQYAASRKDIQEMHAFVFELISFCVLSELTIMFINYSCDFSVTVVAPEIFFKVFLNKHNYTI